MVYVIFLSYVHTYISYVKHNKSSIHKYVKTCIKSIHKCHTPHLCKRWQKRQQPAQRTVNIYHDIMRVASHWLPTMYACIYQAYMSTVLHVYYMHCMYCTYSMFCMTNDNNTCNTYIVSPGLGGGHSQSANQTRRQERS